MKANHIFLLAYTCLTIFAVSTAFGQSSVTNAATKATRGSKGFVAGLVYSNISDMKVKSEYKNYISGSKVTDVDETTTSGTHAGLVGLCFWILGHQRWCTMVTRA